MHAYMTYFKQNHVNLKTWNNSDKIFAKLSWPFYPLSKREKFTRLAPGFISLLYYFNFKTIKTQQQRYECQGKVLSSKFLAMIAVV